MHLMEAPEERDPVVGAMPPVDDVGRGDTKTPPLWHTAAKLPHGRWYTDGSFHGRIPLMASSMELEKDRSFDSLVDVVIPRIKSEFDSVVQHLRPPAYPYEIDRELAERGRRVLRVHLGGHVATGLTALREAVRQAIA